jgi:hypothetical protein
VEVIAQGSPEAFAVVDTLLRFTDYPESEVVSVTIWFWYRLSKVSSLPSFSSPFKSSFPLHAWPFLSCFLILTFHLQVLGENAHLLSQNFTLLFQRLVAVLQRQLQYPYDYDTLGRGDQEEFRSWRRELADVLKDAAAVLGGDNCLAVLYMLLEQEYAKWKVVRTTEATVTGGTQSSFSSGSSTSWQAVESCLYSVRAISQFVSKQSALLAKVSPIFLGVSLVLLLHFLHLSSLTPVLTVLPTGDGHPLRLTK